jgi:NAD(P)-dependent dehydrogenase (short-subunit alcohol dehydrogenase family)
MEQCFTIRADVTQEADVASAVAEAVAKYGRIDYAANFAGIVGPPDTIVNLDLAKWKKTLDVNTTGVMLCTKYEMIQMMKQDSITVYVQRRQRTVTPEDPTRNPNSSTSLSLDIVQTLQAD